ncbi:helix-turn-helix domain-containing protein [Hydrocarboniphaga sp.]|uniref:helix-turn-helix domain-containing protein n=1 Tax=Hydrocarboniphaga sp. TaxID=2033016 RepID=UPI003456FAE2
MQERTRCEQRQPDERMMMASTELQGSNMRAMGRLLGRSASTISRELGRNNPGTMDYTPRTRRSCAAVSVVGPGARSPSPMPGAWAGARS